MAETFTVNYNWTKPEVGASVDNWGGYINADLDGIDTTVKAVSNVANAAQTAGQVTAALANYLPLAGGTLTGSLITMGITANGNISLGSASPTFSFRASGAQPVDQKNWDFFEDTAGNLSVRSLNDAYSAASTPLQFVRGTGYLSPTIKATAHVTFAAGVDFGSNLAASTTDLSKHIALYSTTYGFNVTSGRLNAVAASFCYVSGAGDDVYTINNGGISAQYRYTADNIPATHTFYKGRGGSQAGIAPVVQNDFVMQINGSGFTGSGYFAACWIRGQITEPTPSPTAMGSQMDLTVVPQGTATARVSFVFKYGELQINANSANAAPAWLSMSKSGSGQENSIRGYTTGTAAANLRWRMQLGNTAAETGSNTGSDFSLAGYSDTGAAINTPLTISRATGLGTVAGDPTAPLGIATKQYVDGNVTAAPFLPLAGGTLTGGLTLSAGNLVLNSGNIALNAASGQISVGYWYTGGHNYNLSWGAAVQGAIQIGVDNASKVYYLVKSNSAGAPFTLSVDTIAGGTANNFAAWSGSTSWQWAATASDPRLKSNAVAAENDALAAINSIPVIEFDLTPPVEGAEAQHWKWGIMADAGLEAAIPSSLLPAQEYDDGRIMYAGVRELTLIAALIKAVQQLTARVEELEAAR